MRVLFVGLFLLFSAECFGAVITIVNDFQANSHCAAKDGCTTAGVNSTGANSVSCIVSYSTGSSLTVTGNKSETYVGRTVQAGTFVTYAEYDAKNVTGGAAHTMTLTGTSIYANMACLTFTNGDTSTLFNNETGYTDTLGNNIHATGNVTPSLANTILIAGIGFSGSVSVVSCDNGFSTVYFNNFSSGANYGVAACYKIQTTATAEGTTFDWTSDVEDVGGVTALNNTISLAAGVKNRGLLMGVGP